jgi:hypothetical protein
MGTALTTTEPRGLTLHSVTDAMTFGKMLADSEFAPKDFRGKPASCVLAIQHGAEIGLGPMQAIQSIAVINGRPSIWGDAALALVMASPVCEFVRERIEGDGDKAVAICEAKRKGYPEATVSRFSVEDAKRAGLWGKTGPWTQYSRRMMQLRARGFALRDAFPDVLKGLITTEEAADYPTPAPAPRAESAQEVPRLESKPAEDPVASARTAINGAKSVPQLDKIVALVNKRHGEGIFTAKNVADLLGLANLRAEFLKGDAYEEPANA